MGNPDRKHGLDFSAVWPCSKGCWASSCGAAVSRQRRSSPHQASWACGNLGVQKHVESRPFSSLQKTSGIPSNWPCSLSFMCPEQRSVGKTEQLMVHSVDGKCWLGFLSPRIERKRLGLQPHFEALTSLKEYSRYTVSVSSLVRESDSQSLDLS